MLPPKKGGREWQAGDVLEFVLGAVTGTIAPARTARKGREPADGPRSAPPRKLPWQ